MMAVMGFKKGIGYMNEYWGLRITFKRLINGTAGGEELMELGEKNS